MEKNYLKKSGQWIMIVLAVLPLVFWLLGNNLNLRFANIGDAMKSLGDIFGLCGMAMFALVIILSARLKVYEKFFGGINEVYKIHHVFGALAFCLLLFHPLFLSIQYFMFSLKSAILFFLPSFTNMPKNFGSLSMFVMTVAIVVTFYASLKYHVWKYTHKFLGLAFIFGFFHTFLIGGDLVNNFSLKAYLFVLSVLAIIVYFYRALFADFFVKTLDYKVKNIRQLPDKTWEVEFAQQGKEMKFNAGQFVFLRLGSEYFSREQHPFTISSAPGQPLRLAIKELGDYTGKMSKLKVGDEATVEGPFGNFNFKNYGKNQIWIAGGVGITPFLSMARSLSDVERDYKIILYHSVRDNNSFAFKEDLEKIADKKENFKIVFWDSASAGLLTAEKIKENSPDFFEKDFSICGPSAMMQSVSKQLTDFGVESKKIHMEDFAL